MTGQVHADVDLAALFNAIDQGDVDAMAAFLRDDLVARLGNQPPLHGAQAFKDLYAQLTMSISGIRHELHDVWTAAGDEAIRVVRMTVHYTRLDGNVVSLPCCNTFRLRDGAIAEYQVYVDLTPVFA
ncbi:MAG: nuclear transport factor 2 family protein [Solirubrobacteraceae bacterium]